MTASWDTLRMGGKSISGRMHARTHSFMPGAVWSHQSTYWNIFARWEETREPRGKPMQTQGLHAQSFPGAVFQIWTPEQYPQVLGGHPLSNE